MSEVAIVSDVAAAAAELFVEATAGAAAARGTASVALTGGSTAAPLYAKLVKLANIPWAATHLFFTDERQVPPDDSLSNYRIAEESLFSKLSTKPASVHRLIGESSDLAAEAKRASQELQDTLGDPARLDLVLLGLGPDGHVMSLFAGVPDSAERDGDLVRAVAAPEHVEPKVARLTLSPMMLITARTVVLQVSGAKKAQVLKRALEGPDDLVACPAQWLQRAAGRVVVVCDPEAASAL